MKKIKNNKGFALAEILAVTLVLMIIFTVLYDNFMPLSGEYTRAENYKDVSSQYELHYFRKLFKNNILESGNYQILINNEINECSISSNESICNSLKNELNPTLILTKYNIKELKQELKQNLNTLSDLRGYILNLPDYNNRDGQDEIYRLIMKTKTGYSTVSLKYEAAKLVPIINIPEGQDCLTKVTHEVDDTLQVDAKFKEEYRYRGGNSCANNYVKFNNELWRIIGVIPTEDTDGNVENRLKIIKSETIGSYRWSDSGMNNWVTSSLNTYLNSDYYNTLSSDAKNMIGTTKYYLGGGFITNFASADMWQRERKNEVNRTGYYYGTNPVMQNDASKKIAIMYASDYGYAASKECTKVLTDYSADTLCKTTNNWLDNSEYTWLLPQDSRNNSVVFYIGAEGYANDYVYAGVNQYNVRPVLTLSSDVEITSGKGTSSDPYILYAPTKLISGGDNCFETTDNSDGTLTISNYRCQKGNTYNYIPVLDVTIPSKINNKTVTKIGTNAFSSKGLTSVTIPGSVKTISTSAFVFNTNLKTVNLNEGLESIGTSSFQMCNIETFEIPSTVTTIEGVPFAKSTTSNPNLTKIINKTGRAFPFGSIVYIGGSSEKIITGTVSDSTSSVTITSS